MKKLKSLTLAALTAATAFATPAVKADARFQSHANLFGAVEEAGVRIFFNDREACADKWGGGMYATNRDGRAAILICQDDGERIGTGNLVPMSPNDADSLRHEAHHLVQDCLDGRMTDGELETLFEGSELEEFVKRGLDTKKIEWIIETYGSKGADKEEILLELEAFSVAANVDPDKIANAIRRYCF